jgi:hypothetical protein
MVFKLPALGSLLVIIASAIAFPASAAEDTQVNYEYETPPEVIERAYFKNGPNFFGNNTKESDIDLILGPGSLFKNSFPENKIARDAQLVHIIYQDLLYQQASSDPYLRTPDLPNPYNSSLLMSPRFNTNQMKLGTEYRFEDTPFAVKSSNEK